MQDGPRFLTETDLNTLTTAKQTQYGAVGVTEDGRQFRYVSFGGTSTVAPGLLMQAAVAKTNAAGLAIPAAGTGGQTTANLAAGSTTLVVTNGATAVAQDEFAEGFLEALQTSGTNEGPISYRIVGNSAAVANTGYITVLLAEPLRNAEALVAGTDTVNLWTSPYQGVIATTTVNVPIGVNIQQVVNSATVTNYGWVQSKGTVMAFQDASTAAIGNAVGPSTTTAGYIGLAVGVTKPPIGWYRNAPGTGVGGSIQLNIS